MITKHSNQVSRGWSNLVWKNCPFLGIGAVPLLDPDQGIFFHNDWAPAPTFIAAGASQMGHAVIIDTGGTLQQGDGHGGLLVGTFDGTDEDEIYYGVGAAGGGWILAASATAASRRSWWFETRHKVSQVASMAMFIGLADNSAIVADALVDATGALIDDDFIGFHIDSGAFASIDAVWRKGGQARTEPTGGSAITAIAADTYLRLGMTYDAPSDMLRWFVDGVEKCSQKVASASVFPLDVNMVPVLLHKTTAATASTFTNDWLTAAQAG